MSASSSKIEIVVRGLGFALLWIVLTEGNAYAWWFGVLVVAAATAASAALQPPVRLRPLGLLRLLPFFLKQSLLGGVDVARRAFDPRMPLDPIFVACPLRLPPGPAQIALADTMSLLPGTVSVDLHGNDLRLHVLDRSLPAIATLRQLEDRLGDAFGVEVAPVTSEESDAHRD
jgi:multicomponent Na+:H+ antiporter subunit E